MKCPFWIGAGALFIRSVHAASILSGPVYNPANSHIYFLLSSSPWTDAEATAVSMGGHLVTVNDAAENAWLLSAFSNFGDQPRALWTGLTDATKEGLFSWSSGEPVTYTNWEVGQPDDGRGFYPHEDYVLIWPSPGPRSPGYWNDYIDTNTFTQFGLQVFGVVEIPTGPTLPARNGSRQLGRWKAMHGHPVPLESLLVHYFRLQLIPGAFVQIRAHGRGQRQVSRQLLHSCLDQGPLVVNRKNCCLPEIGLVTVFNPLTTMGARRGGLSGDATCESDCPWAGGAG
jgi:hypothetical protein